VHLHRQPGLALGEQRATQAGLLRRGEVRADADLPDDPGPDAVLADGHVLDDPLRDRLRREPLDLGGLRGVEVVAGAGDDVGPRGLAQAPQGAEIAAESEPAGLDDRAPAEAAEACDLGERQLGVGEPAVVAVAEPLTTVTG